MCLPGGSVLPMLRLRSSSQYMLGGLGCGVIRGLYDPRQPHPGYGVHVHTCEGVCLPFSVEFKRVEHGRSPLTEIPQVERVVCTGCNQRALK